MQRKNGRKNWQVGESWRQAAKNSPDFAGRDLATAGSLVGARVNKPTAEEMFSRQARHLVVRRDCFCSTTINMPHKQKI
ncbi:hypothetical protein A2U01_0055884, partial [Trifolium medium]|nr:hypothetical protein [Trifolium medium]